MQKECTPIAGVYPKRIRLKVARNEDEVNIVIYVMMEGSNIGDPFANEFDEEPADAGKPACVSLPSDFVNQRYKIFQCPECLANVRRSTIAYSINRGSRDTRRMYLRTSVIMVVVYLRSVQRQAEVLLQQVASALGGLEVEVDQYFVMLPQGFRKEAVGQMMSHKEDYHLAFMIMTESDPRGGWWFSDDKDAQGRLRADEAQVLGPYLKTLQPLAERAKSARIFIFACGTNINGSAVVESLWKMLTP
ncbi:hypothetical protein FRC11_006613 [Ceratobasidium sp. 423]|nr:hypothetical protein FRC11_006613 [Ceratobasidium sp. 423]